RKEFLVEPGTRVKLHKVDPGYHGKHVSHTEALPEIDKRLEELTNLQFLLYSEHKRSLLVVLQALDAAGKDGTIRHVLKAMNPQGTTVAAFKHPTAEELDHDFLWRVHGHTPGRGEVAIFNRSHYEDVLVVRVHKLVTQEVWRGRYDLINEFERLL